MSNMDWKEINIKPKEKYGWFAVAIVPNNYDHDLEGANSWRNQFGFTKAWLNNNQWWEADQCGGRSRNITDRVTHWDYLPEVPMLEKPHMKNEGWLLYRSRNREEIEKLCDQYIKDYTHNNGYNIHYDDYKEGFVAAFKLMGIL